MMKVVQSIWNVDIKKLMSFLLLIAGVHFCSPAKAGNVDTELFYCPPEINCETDKEQDSCSYDQHQRMFWDKLVFDNEIKAGKYQFYHVDSPYHAKYVTATQCRYRYNNSKIDTVMLQSKLLSNLEAYYVTSTNWGVERFVGFCNAKTPSLCPLKEQSAVIINNNTDAKLGLYVELNGEPPYGVIMPNNDITKITYDDFWLCKGANRCSVNICVLDKDSRCNYYYDLDGSLKFDIIGTLEVDMDLGVKIVSITPHDYSTYNIKKIETFNTITVEDTGEFPDYTIEVVNWLNSNVVLRVKDSWVIRVLYNGNTGKASYKDVYKSCKSADKCTIDVATESGVRIGQIFVDMKNKMAISAVSSEKPNEILLLESGSNLIDIKYASF